jgi:ABC-type transporter Mla MlaB component
MATAVWQKTDKERVVLALQEARENLDLSSGRRVDPGAMRAMEEFADTADDKAVRVALRGVNVDVYKVLKLVKLASRFFFVA